MSPATHHKEILRQIKNHSGKPTQHSFLDGYLGNDHPKFAIRAPQMRAIAKNWLKANKDVGPGDLAKVVTRLIHAPSSTEKCMGGVILDYATKDQMNFKPEIFDDWLDHLVGWAEIDTLCTGTYAAVQIPAQWTEWKKLLFKFSKDKNINKRRASLVLFCTPLRKEPDPKLMTAAFQIIDKLKHEKEIIITKAVSWVLRSGIKNHKAAVARYLRENRNTLPAIAVRETERKLRTGRK